MILKDIIKRIQNRDLDSWVGWIRNKYSQVTQVKINSESKIEYRDLSENLMHEPYLGELDKSSTLMNSKIIENPLDISWWILCSGYITKPEVDLYDCSTPNKERFNYIGYVGSDLVGTITYPNGETFTGLLNYLDLKGNKIFFVNEFCKIIKKPYHNNCKFELVDKSSYLYEDTLKEFTKSPDGVNLLLPKKEEFLTLDGKIRKIHWKSIVGRKINFHYLDYKKRYKEVTGIVDRYSRRYDSTPTILTINETRYYPENIILIREVK